MTLTLHSSSFNHGDAMPAKYTCSGDDVSPPLSWQGVPAETKSLVLIIDDPDAPDPKEPKMTWVHWVLYNMPPETTGLAEGITAGALPAGTEQGLNDWNRTNYGGPCPPIGRHRYFHKLYALDTMLNISGKANKPKIEAAMQGHILASAELIGTFAKS